MALICYTEYQIKEVERLSSTQSPYEIPPNIGSNASERRVGRAMLHPPSSIFQVYKSDFLQKSYFFHGFHFRSYQTLHFKTFQLTFYCFSDKQLNLMVSLCFTETKFFSRMIRIYFFERLL